ARARGGGASPCWCAGGRGGSAERGAGRGREPIPLAGSRVLIVDDNPTNRVILFALARRWGMEPVPSGSAAEALSVLRQHRAGDRIRLLLLDLHMPGTDGFGLAERIRAEPEFDDLAIVLLTSAGGPAALRRCEELRIAGQVMKPAKEYELYDVVARALGHRVGPAAGAPFRATRRVASAEGKAPAAALPPQRILLVEDS